MKGTILYQCRVCGQDDIPISAYVEMVFCPTCNKEIELIQSSKEYLRQIFLKKEFPTTCQNAIQTSPVATGCTERGKK